MRALPLLLLTLLGWPAATLASSGLSGCKEDSTTCREDCSVEYGSSSRAYSKLKVCLGKCRNKYNLCRDRHLALQEEKDLGIEANPASSTPPPAKEPTRFSASDEDPAEDKAPATAVSDTATRRGVYRATEPEPEKPEAPATASRESSEKRPAPTPAAPLKSVTSEPVVRRNVYRAAEPEPEPVKLAEPAKPAPTPAATVAAKPDPLLDDEDPPPPPPKPAPKPSTKPALPPEPKHDISEWDPNGD
jgi:hypothetical protein